MSDSNQPPSKNNKWMALVVLLIALLLLVGGIGVALKMSPSASTDGKNVPQVSLGDPMRGRQVVLKYGCVTCHTDDGTRAQGPSFKGLFNSTQQYIDGSTGVVNEEDVRYALREPSGKVIDTYEAQMPKFSDRFSEEETVNLIAYLRSIGLPQP